MQRFDLDGRVVGLPDADHDFPQVLSLQSDDAGICLRLDVVPELSCFRGHFPDQPVLPGVVQLHWAVQVAERCFDVTGIPTEIKRLKFKKVVTPPQELELRVSRRSDKEIQFNFSAAGEANSEGRLVFPEAASC